MKYLIKILAVSSILLVVSAEAKNVILFVGDGMGVSTITAARIYVGQQRGSSGEEHDLSFDRFESVALVKTYNTDAQVPDSAGTITAMLAGAKTRRGVLGISQAAARDDCAASLQNEIPSILELAEERGKSSGVVSTARITHATPAGAYSHVPNRDWENSTMVTSENEAAGCRDIALQLLESPHGDGPDVILGGGRAQFMPSDMADPEYPEKKGLRDDGRDLIQEWLKRGPNREYVWNSASFDAIGADHTGQIMGLFEPSHMQFEADRENDAGGEPSLAAMTEIAIDRLSQNTSGYFLLVEGGRIDHAHHFGNAYRALVDTQALDDAVAVAVAKTNPDETLIVVTADHSHTLTISGYPPRGNPILGKVDQSMSPVLPGVEVLPYTTLGYANGPGYATPYPDISDVDTTDPNYRQIAAVPLPIETHAGEDVAAFATGVNADAMRGVIEQSELFQIMMDALFADEGD
ncbi:MAG: alkaline phosphatase [Pseudomonadales bacterium]|nr:alkaline phosphatase [Pseudomonadales bacterium]